MSKEAIISLTSFISHWRRMKLNSWGFYINRNNWDFLYLSALSLYIYIMIKYSRQIGKAWFLLVMVFSSLVMYDFYLMLQNPQAYCINFLTRIAYPFTVLSSFFFDKNCKFLGFGQTMLWKFHFALRLPIFRSLGGA